MKRVKSVLMAQLNQEQIAGYTQKLEDLFGFSSLVSFVLVRHVTEFGLEICYKFHRSADTGHARRNGRIAQDRGRDDSLWCFYICN